MSGLRCLSLRQEGRNRTSPSSDMMLPALAGPLAASSDMGTLGTLTFLDSQAERMIHSLRLALALREC